MSDLLPSPTLEALVLQIATYAGFFLWALAITLHWPWLKRANGTRAFIQYALAGPVAAAISSFCYSVSVIQIDHLSTPPHIFYWTIVGRIAADFGALFFIRLGWRVNHDTLGVTH